MEARDIFKARGQARRHISDDKPKARDVQLHLNTNERNSLSALLGGSSGSVQILGNVASAFNDTDLLENHVGGEALSRSRRATHPAPEIVDGTSLSVPSSQGGDLHTHPQTMREQDNLGSLFSKAATQGAEVTREAFEANNAVHSGATNHSNGTRCAPQRVRTQPQGHMEALLGSKVPAALNIVDQSRGFGHGIVESRDVEGDRIRIGLLELERRQHGLLHQRHLQSRVLEDMQVELREHTHSMVTRSGAPQRDASRLREHVDVVQVSIHNFLRASQQGHTDAKQELVSLRQSVASDAELAQVKGELARTTDEFQRLRSSLQQDQARIKAQIDALTTAKVNLKKEVAGMNREIQATMSEVQGTKGVEDERRRKHEEQQRQIQQLKDKTQSQNELVAAKAQGELNTITFRNLTKSLQERGVWAPKREEPPEEQEIPPVGTIELGQDCFTARLLIRLGYMKARGWKECDSDNEDIENDSADAAGNSVTGLQEPEIVEGHYGYFSVMEGWLGICVVTMILQILVVVVMLKNGADTGDDCLEEAPSWGDWLLLHVSKACAMCVSGVLLAKELMDIMNYWMVSELLEPTRNVEVAVSACMRVILTFLVAVASVVIYMSLTSPASVWMNATALSFIYELSASVLDVSKRGVFGHPISKTMTTLNFELTFVSEYPPWFSYVRSIALTVCFGSIAILTVIIFLKSDNLCPNSGT
mmetsp:Transcript_69494/g.137438  ORF Transcript_69494/g.137438 Transcript_69494/m.137438 type:complete len:706 (-) Transcript_69494:27-2144(-)